MSKSVLYYLLPECGMLDFNDFVFRPLNKLSLWKWNICTNNSCFYLHHYFYTDLKSIDIAGVNICFFLCKITEIKLSILEFVRHLMFCSLSRVCQVTNKHKAKLLWCGGKNYSKEGGQTVSFAIVVLFGTLNTHTKALLTKLWLCYICNVCLFLFCGCNNISSLHDVTDQQKASVRPVRKLILLAKFGLFLSVRKKEAVFSTQNTD